MREKTTTAAPIESIAFLLSAEKYSVIRLAIIADISVDAAHIQEWRPTSKGRNGKSVSAAASSSVNSRRVKGIDHMMGGSLKFFTISTIERSLQTTHAWIRPSCLLPLLIQFCIFIAKYRREYFNILTVIFFKMSK